MYCRSTTAPHFDDDFWQIGERAARDAKSGGTYYIPADITYKEWKARFANEDDSDIESVKNGIKNVLSGNSRRVLQNFKDTVSSISNKDASKIFLNLLKETPVKVSFKRRSFHRNGEIFLSNDATPSTLAHELFHKLDTKYGISESGILSGTIVKDYERLNIIAKGYGQSIPDMLYIRYKNAFESSKCDAVRFKQKYRGISDILNGMSGGGIRLGYKHQDEYWKHELAVEKETLAQIGRILYDDDRDVMKMLSDIFPETYATVLSKLKELA